MPISRSEQCPYRKGLQVEGSECCVCATRGLNVVLPITTTTIVHAMTRCLFSFSKVLFIDKRTLFLIAQLFNLEGAIFRLDVPRYALSSCRARILYTGWILMDEATFYPMGKITDWTPV